MKRININLMTIALALVCQFCTSAEQTDNNTESNPTANENDTAELWPADKANDWYAEQGWLIGSNYNPRTAINQLEMWQEADFDTATIREELGWARGMGMNTMRVYLHDLLWEQDSTGLLDRMDTFLEMSAANDIKPLFVIFDSCWDPFPQTGTQRDPKPHVHNSGWVQSPGYHALEDETQYPRLENYVKGVINRFADDERILGWDIWNEPDNDTGPSYREVDHPEKEKLVLPLLEKAFAWARSQNPSQPLTSGVWVGDWSTHEGLPDIQKVQLEQSDIISFHSYDDPAEFEKRIKMLQRYDRPIICTEYMARPNGSTFEGFLPVAKQYNIGMYNWGFVDGKTQTKYPWDSWQKAYTSEPDLWFHEVLRSDGEPYKREEVALIKEMTGVDN